MGGWLRGEAVIAALRRPHHAGLGRDCLAKQQHWLAGWLARLADASLDGGVGALRVDHRQPALLAHKRSPLPAVEQARPQLADHLQGRAPKGRAARSAGEPRARGRGPAGNVRARGPPVGRESRGLPPRTLALTTAVACAFMRRPLFVSAGPVGPLLNRFCTACTARTHSAPGHPALGHGTQACGRGGGRPAPPPLPRGVSVALNPQPLRRPGMSQRPAPAP